MNKVTYFFYRVLLRLMIRQSQYEVAIGSSTGMNLVHLAQVRASIASMQQELDRLDLAMRNRVACWEEVATIGCLAALTGLLCGFLIAGMMR